jgi:hypothetical protein
MKVTSNQMFNFKPMGLAINYDGYIKDVALIDALVNEVEDICKTFEWKYNILHDEEIDGILFSPPESEPVHLTFNKQGRLLPVTSLMVKDIYETGELDKELMFTAVTKTQYAGPDAHKAIIKLMRYITEKYFSVFRMEDESYYWETGDEVKMLERFKVYNALVDVFAEALQNLEHVPGETPKSLADRIEELLKTKFKDVDVKKFGGGE